MQRANRSNTIERVSGPMELNKHNAYIYYTYGHQQLIVMFAATARKLITGPSFHNKFVCFRHLFELDNRHGIYGKTTDMKYNSHIHIKVFWEVKMHHKQMKITRKVAKNIRSEIETMTEFCSIQIKCASINRIYEYVYFLRFTEKRNTHFKSRCEIKHKFTKKKFTYTHTSHT